MKTLSVLMFLMTIATKAQSQTMDSIPENAQYRLREILPGISARGFDTNGGNSVNKNILFASKSAILIKNTDELHYLFADYDFNPEVENLSNLKSAFSKVRILVIKHSLENSKANSYYHKIPKWVNTFDNLDCLILDNVIITSDDIVEWKTLKLLGVLHAEISDIQKLIQGISIIEGMEFFMHDETFPTREVEELKKLVPGLITFKPEALR